MTTPLVDRIIASTDSIRSLALQLKAEGHHITRTTIKKVKETGIPPKPGKTRRFDDATILRIRASLASNRAMAKQLQEEGVKISTELVRQIRAGMIYANLLPKDSAPTGGNSCDRCNHWRGLEAIEPCDLGHHDPIDEGLGFARFCATYKKAPA